MKITNLSEHKTPTAWKTGDFYLTDKGELKRVGYSREHGFFVISLDGDGDWSNKYYFRELKSLVSQMKSFGMTRVKIKEIVVEENK
jgi:hypothetical protein